MNYDRVIVELIDRIHALEDEVAALKQRMDGDATSSVSVSEPNNKCSTADIKRYIEAKIIEAKEQGLESIALRASDIHRCMKLKSRFPMVCNAMRQCMKEGDSVLHETPSGYSSSLEILYHCGEE